MSAGLSIIGPASALGAEAEVCADTADVPEIKELAATVPAVTTNWRKTGQRIA